MPQKKNPDILELIRAKSSLMQGYVVQITNIISKLPSGYNRDFQLTKKILMESFDVTKDSLFIMNHLLKEINVNVQACEISLTKEIFATDYAHDLVKNGVPFREAYQTTAQMIDKLRVKDGRKNILSKTHTGATGNLGLRKVRSELDKQIKIISSEKKKFQRVIERLL